MRCILSSVVLCLIGFGLAVWLIYPSDRVLASWTEPSSNSKGTGRYVAVLIERDLQLFFGPFERRRELRIQSKTNGEVAHIVPVELFGEARTRECNSTCEVKWGEKGMEFSQISGDKIFIPAGAYEGGR